MCDLLITADTAPLLSERQRHGKWKMRTHRDLFNCSCNPDMGRRRRRYNNFLPAIPGISTLGGSVCPGSLLSVFAPRKANPVISIYRVTSVDYMKLLLLHLPRDLKIWHIGLDLTSSEFGQDLTTVRMIWVAGREIADRYEAAIWGLQMEKYASGLRLRVFWSSATFTNGAR